MSFDFLDRPPTAALARALELLLALGALDAEVCPQVMLAFLVCHLSARQQMTPAGV